MKSEPRYKNKSDSEIRALKAKQGEFVLSAIDDLAGADKSERDYLRDEVYHEVGVYERLCAELRRREEALEVQ